MASPIGSIIIMVIVGLVCLVLIVGLFDWIKALLFKKPPERNSSSARNIQGKGDTEVAEGDLVNRFDQRSLVDFPAWLSLYKTSQIPDDGKMARAFLIQSLHMAEKLGAISTAAKNELSIELQSENPVRVVNEWLEIALPNVVEVVGSESLSDVPARQVGALMIVALMGVNPQRDLRDFMQQFGR